MKKMKGYLNFARNIANIENCYVGRTTSAIFSSRLPFLRKTPNKYNAYALYILCCIT